MAWLPGKRSIRIQLLAAAILIEVIMLSVLVWNGQRLTRHYLMTETETHMNEMMPLIEAALTGPLVQEDLATLKELLVDILQNGQIRYVEIHNSVGELMLKKGEQHDLLWMKRQDLTSHIIENDSNARFAFQEPLNVQGRTVGYIGLQLDISVINMALQALLTQSVTIATIEVGLTVLFLSLTGYALTRHLATLSHSVREVVSGDFSHRVAISANDEIGDVALAINQLLDEVEQSHDRITDQNDEILRLARLSPVGMFQTDEMGRCTYVNSRWCEITGLDAEQAMGDGWSKSVHADDLNRVMTSWQRAVSTLSVFEVEFRFIHKKQDVWVSVRAEPHIQQGRLQHYFGGMTDITARKRTDNIIQVLAKGVRQQTYDAFLRDTVKNLASLYGVKYAFIGTLSEDEEHVEIKAMWDGRSYLDEITYHLQGTPCQHVLNKKKELFEKGVWHRFPGDEFLAEHVVDSYFGTVVLSSSGEIMGLISLMDTKPMNKDIWNDPALEVFATRVAVEMERYSTLVELESHQRHLEDLVRVRTSRMEQLNSELESFCYSVSHDLRAPLRSINGFTQALIEDYAPVFDEQGLDYLTRVCRGASRMSDLIDALLEISRVTRSNPVNEAVDLGELAGEIIEELRTRYPQRAVSVDIKPGLIVSADKRFMKIILENMLENAWKYTSKKENAKIEVGVLQIDGVNTYYIRDDGVGFDMRYASKLFEAFQRLHLPEEFEGTGIGLATVYKIVQLYSGRIWADALPGKGATFYFTLAPARQRYSA